MKETEIEQEIQEKGLTAARVTLEDVHNAKDMVPGGVSAETKAA